MKTINNPFFSVRNLTTTINTEVGVFKAVDNISFNINKQEIFGLVGESGCGKTITAKSILKILPKSAEIIKGDIYLESTNLIEFNNSQIRKIRGNVISMIFQEPMTSLNPVFKIGNQIDEILKTHKTELNKKERYDKVIKMLKLVGIPSPNLRLNNYPFQLSGGMRQRVMIAMSLICGNPKLLIADEPTTALDVTIQAQILNLIRDLVNKIGMSVLLITHDLGIIAQNAKRMAVMYGGSIVETGEVKDIFLNPLHPYTRGLIKSLPFHGESGKKEKLYSIKGVVPNLVDLKIGCKFYDRCEYASSDLCLGREPDLVHFKNEHSVRCVKVMEFFNE